MSPGADDPAQRVPREPAPPYRGEGPFALWHFSEDPALCSFVPRLTPTNPAERPLVWAVDTLESGWLQGMRDCRLYAYRLPAETFSPHPTGGYWVSDATVRASERITVGDLLDRHARAGIELRITPSLRPFWDRVVSSTVEFSGVRLHHSG